MNKERTSDFVYKTMYKAEIDVASDYPISDFMSWIEEHNLEQRLIQAFGPGGGNPCFEISAKNKNDLLVALAEFHDCDIADIKKDYDFYKNPKFPNGENYG